MFIYVVICQISAGFNRAEVGSAPFGRCKQQHQRYLIGKKQQNEKKKEEQTTQNVLSYLLIHCHIYWGYRYLNIDNFNYLEQ